MSNPRTIRAADRRRIWKQPCAACGLPHMIHIDHILPVCRGGTNDSDNLQALCRRCNFIKGGRLMSNRQIAARVVMEGAEKHFLYWTYRGHRNVSDNPYDGPVGSAWYRKNPSKYFHALELAHVFEESRRWAA